MLLHRVPAAHGQDDIKFNTPYGAFPAADGNIIVRDEDCVRLISSDGVFVKEVKPPELGADEHWSPYTMSTGPKGEVCMRDADYGLLWTFEESQLDCGFFLVDHKGRLVSLNCERNILEIWEVEFRDRS